MSKTKLKTEELPSIQDDDYVETQKSLPTIKEPAELPAVADEPFDDGLGDVTQEDLIIPRLRVGQKQSEGDVEGKLFIDVTGDAVEEMTLVILKMHKSRILFPEDFNLENDPLCKSDDSKVPNNAEDVFTPMSDTCADCEYAKWTKNDAGKSKPPRCNESWDFLVLDYNTFMPCWFSLKSTALKPARKIVSMLKLRGTVKKIPAWGFKFTASVSMITSPAGNSYVPVFSSLDELEADDFEQMTLIHNQLSGEQANFEDEKPVGQKAEEVDDNF